jgi:hypothetical protein
VVAIVYSIPMAAGYAYRGSTLVPGDWYESVYLARIVDAYRGGSLGNPYLAGHEDAPRYMPELVERSLAGIARLTGLKPLAVVAISRIAFPAGIALLIAILGRALGLRERPAAFAALLATLGDPRSLVRVFDPAWVSFPRYFRAVSPASHVLLLLLALVAVEHARRKGTWRTALLAGIALSILFYTPVYYWSVALAGTVWLTLRAKPPQRRFLLGALGVATVCAIPYARQSIALAQDPSIQETLARHGLLIPGRSPDGNVLPVFFTGVIFLILGFVILEGRPVLAFLTPFLTAGTFFLLQNMVTNRHVQARHWVNCLIPLWALLISAWLAERPLFLRAAVFPLLFSLVAAAALATVSISAIREQWRAPVLYPLDAMKPATVQWLRSHTPRGSIIFCTLPFVGELPLFTENKIYWGGLASQHVLSDSECVLRSRDTDQWTPAARAKLHYPADYYLGGAGECPANDANFLYANAKEDTCVIRIRR